MTIKYDDLTPRAFENAVSRFINDEYLSHNDRIAIADYALAELRHRSSTEETAISLLVELENLFDAFADRVEKLAFEMKPPNPYTPQFVQAVQHFEGELRKIKARGLTPSGDPQR